VSVNFTVPAKVKTSEQINLIPKEGFNQTTSGRILMWLLSTFRIILIVTELVVIAAFVSRFWLDAKNSDLSDKIKEDTSIITSLSGFEQEFKDVQWRLSIDNSYISSKGQIISALNSILQDKPPAITFSYIIADTASISIQAKSPSEIDIQQFYTNLKADKNLNEVLINTIQSSKDENNFILDLSIKFNKV
jgi:hypothetical protein